MKNIITIIFCMLIFGNSVLAADIQYGYRNGQYKPVSVGDDNINYGYRNGQYLPTSFGD